jgi:hypothetical protein
VAVGVDVGPARAVVVVTKDNPSATKSAQNNFPDRFATVRSPV